MDFSPAIAAESVLSNLLLQRHPPSPASATASVLSISAVGFLPTDSAAPPVAVRSDPYRCSVAPCALVRRSRRTRRKSSDLGGDDDDGLSGDGDDGSFGGGGGGGGGRDWGFGGSGGGSDWGENHGRGSPDPAFDFVYEVVLWIALSNCALFAFKKVGRILEEREKVLPIRLVPSVC